MYRTKPKILSYLCFLCLGFSFPLESKDFGIQGELFSILEENLILFLQKQLSSKNPAPTSQTLIEQIKERAKHPKLSFVPTNATQNRISYYDPTYIVPESIKDKAGNIIVQKGTQINPLKHLPLSNILLFFDGNNPHHIEWAREQKEPAKWILVTGNPFKLEEQEKRPVYFDQNGFSINKFKLEHIPVRITQEGLLLKIEEIHLKDEKVIP